MENYIRDVCTDSLYSLQVQCQWPATTHTEKTSLSLKYYDIKLFYKLYFHYSRSGPVYKIIRLAFGSFLLIQSS
jgi:hypothetical protein